VDLREVAAAIANIEELRPIYRGLEYKPVDLELSGKDVRDETRSFRTHEQRRALPMQIHNTILRIRQEYDTHSRMTDRIRERVRSFEETQGKQAVASLLAGAFLIPQ
jgi:hypothetical protein